MLSKLKRKLRIWLGGKLEEEILEKVARVQEQNDALLSAFTGQYIAAQNHYREGIYHMAALTLAAGGEVVVGESILNMINENTFIEVKSHPDGSTTYKIVDQPEQGEEQSE